MEDIVYIVENEIINKIDNSVTITEIVSTNSVKLCSVAWLKVGKTLTVSGNSYIVESIDFATGVVTLTTAFTDSIGVGYIELPAYRFGTPKTTNMEWSPNELGATPCVWLVEPVSERFMGNESSVERESDLRLLLIDSRDAVNWLNKDIHDNRSASLYLLQDAVVKAINNNAFFKRFTDFSSRNLTKLGTENAQGFERNIIDSDLTALDLRLTLPIYKRSNNCIC